MDEQAKTEHTLVGWVATIGGLLIGWRVWQWRAPTGDEINAAGAGAIMLVGFAAFWTLLAVAFGGAAVYTVAKGLGAVGRSVADGWRRSGEKWDRGEGRWSGPWNR